jgi:hypothetical protein
MIFKTKLTRREEKNRVTRAQAEYALTHGGDPADYLNHANKHVKAKAAKAAARRAPGAA